MPRKPESARFGVMVYLTQPIDFQSDERAEDYIGTPQKRQIEKDVLQALRKLDGDADAECLEADLLDADGRAISTDERDEEYERLAARDRLNNFDRTGGKDWT
jgi:hypothetical protein